MSTPHYSQDYLSVITAGNNENLNNLQITKLLKRFNSLLDQKHIQLCWIPIHIGIPDKNSQGILLNENIKFTPPPYKLESHN